MLTRFFIGCILGFCALTLSAQPSKCIFKEALVKIDFGNGQETEVDQEVVAE